MSIKLSYSGDDRNCSESLRLLAYSLGVVSAMTGNLPLGCFLEELFKLFSTVCVSYVCGMTFEKKFIVLFCFVSIVCVWNVSGMCQKHIQC